MRLFKPPVRFENKRESDDFFVGFFVDHLSRWRYKPHGLNWEARESGGDQRNCSISSHYPRYGSVESKRERIRSDSSDRLLRDMPAAVQIEKDSRIGKGQTRIICR
jgi:hypothetical protein